MQKFEDLKRQEGNITPIFCMLVFVLLGGISYSLYIGQLVTDRIAEQTAADVSSLAAANHVAQGLNMISANNLSIGAAVQVAGSLSNLAFYLGTVRALMISENELPEFSGQNGRSPAQRVVFDRMAKISGPFLQTASGLTHLNEGIQKNWQYMTPVRALEVARINVPGSIAISVPRAAVEGLKDTETNIYQFAGMRTTEPKNTICATYKAAEMPNMEGVSQMLTWLSAPFASLTGGATEVLGSLNSKIRYVESMVNSGPFRVSITPGSEACGLELKAVLDLSIKVPKKLQRLGWPKKVGLGERSLVVPISYHGLQAKYFAGQNENRKDTFGFLIPNKIEEDGSASDFEKSIEYAEVLTTPLRSARQVNSGNCPAAWKRGSICDGIGLAAMVDESLKKQNIETNAATGKDEWKDSDDINHDVNIGSGGLHEAMRSGGDLYGTMGRMKYRLSQAKAIFKPFGNSGAAAEHVGRTHQQMSTFWPGWQSTLTHSTLLSGILGKITDIAGLEKFADK